MTEGAQSSYIKCQKCNQTNTKPQFFYDLFITYKMFGGKTHSSVEEALETVFLPEELSGDNKYMCDNCGSKQDAWKGLRIDRLPEYVTLYVNRFEIDYTTFQRKKVKGQMAFSENLQFLPYMDKEIYKDAPEGESIFASNFSGFRI